MKKNNKKYLSIKLEDNYNLINSKAIGDYCRKIQYQFNTEELAVLIFRNNKLSIDQKIKKYQELIDSYPDMEVIKRINCKYYDSVKTMINEEIERLKINYKELIKDDGNSIYMWDEYNKSTKEWGRYNSFEEITKKFDETYKKASDYVEEYDDTIRLKIQKKSFNKDKSIITAYYNIINKKLCLIDIVKDEDNYRDSINQIFVNIPTPFKKGDILINKNNGLDCFNYSDNEEIFVLDFMCNWKKNIDKSLKRGNFDSSDMIAYGYYLCENSTEFVCDIEENYDSLEYYTGKLEGKNRILKDISSLIKGKISIELFVHAYEYYKKEFNNKLTNLYTDEGLKLAGMTESDIKKIKR